MRTQGGYKTKQRESILQCLNENPDRHFSVDEIFDFLKSRGEQVGKTTVYRYIDKLCAEGLVRKYLLPEGDGACYQLCNKQCREHFHLKCVMCGALLHTECNFLSEVACHVEKEHGFVINPGLTVLYGLCASCGANHNAFGFEKAQACHCQNVNKIKGGKNCD